MDEHITLENMTVHVTYATGQAAVHGHGLEVSECMSLIVVTVGTMGPRTAFLLSRLKLFSFSMDANARKSRI